jgi:catechol 2,3-dioxygenase-like lactoylglutathione lyase family enzyme
MISRIAKGRCVKIHSTTPILRIFDEAKAKEFYVDFLGLKVDWEHRFEPGLPRYLQVSRDGCILHQSEHHGDCCPGSTMRIAVDGIDELHAELTAKQFNFARPTLNYTHGVVAICR